MNYFKCLFISIFYMVSSPIMGASGDHPLESLEQEAREYGGLSFEDFQEEYIDQNKPFHSVEHGGDRSILYKKWIKKNGSDIPLFCWILEQEGIPKEDAKAQECELCGHTELGELNLARHSLRGRRIKRYVGNRCIEYAVKGREALYRDYVRSLQDLASKLRGIEAERERRVEDDALKEAERSLKAAAKQAKEEKKQRRIDNQREKAEHRSTRKRPRG
ncbi:MAG: hypothetical protein Q8Q56_01305 [Alphaproteobacteria bacterium]|nr:hypothetical protein [Alphaproteobacteria bacterium]